MRKFFRDSKSIGIVLFCCTVASLVFSNISGSAGYCAYWNTRFIASHLFPASLLHIINDGLMTVFFFFAGLEIKRELISGELNSLKRSLMPVISAVGGMIVPALLYLFFCHQAGNIMGWGIPMATDIAFSLAILSLCGKRVPAGLRIFLTALAIIDDAGGIIVITFFYPGTINRLFLFWSVVSVIGLIVLNYLKLAKLFLFLSVGLLLWFFVFNSGISPTIAGVILAFTIPSATATGLQHKLHFPVHFFILPLFVLANTAITIPAHFLNLVTSPVYAGVFTGLFIGKPLGIYLFARVASFMKIAELPKGMSGMHLLSVGVIAGIGFTVSLFITALAFPDESLRVTARWAVISASVFSGIAGYLLLKRTPNNVNKNV